MDYGYVMFDDLRRYSYSTTTMNSTLTVTGLTAIDMGEFVCEVSLSNEVITSSPAQLTLNDYSSPSVLQGYVYQVSYRGVCVIASRILHEICLLLGELI